MQNFKLIDEIVQELKQNYPALSDYELLSIAIQKQRNDILIAGLSVCQDSVYPSGIESIAAQLGLKARYRDNDDLSELNLDILD